MGKNAMNNLSYGLFVLTAQKDGFDNGCIINTVQQVTTEPNCITIAVNKSNLTHDMILETNKFNVSIISEKADFELFKHFGFQSGRDVNKFEGFSDCGVSGNGLKYITKGTNAYLSAWCCSEVCWHPPQIQQLPHGRPQWHGRSLPRRSGSA